MPTFSDAPLEAARKIATMPDATLVNGYEAIRLALLASALAPSPRRVQHERSGFAAAGEAGVSTARLPAREFDFTSPQPWPLRCRRAAVRA